MLFIYRNALEKHRLRNYAIYTISFLFGQCFQLFRHFQHFPLIFTRIAATGFVWIRVLNFSGIFKRCVIVFSKSFGHSRLTHFSLSLSVHVEGFDSLVEEHFSAHSHNYYLKRHFDVHFKALSPIHVNVSLCKNAQLC